MIDAQPAVAPNAGAVPGYIQSVDLDAEHGPIVMIRCFVDEARALKIAQHMITGAPVDVALPGGGDTGQTANGARALATHALHADAKEEHVTVSPGAADYWRRQYESALDHGRDLAEVVALYRSTQRDLVEWELLAVELRTRESRMSGVLCDLADVPSDPLEGLTVLAAHYRATRMGKAPAVEFCSACELLRCPSTEDAECPKRRVASGEHSWHRAHPNIDTILTQTKDLPLLGALSLAATWENERAVAQALRRKRDPHTGAMWDTCFRHTFEAVLAQPRPAKAPLDTGPDQSDAPSSETERIYALIEEWADRMRDAGVDRLYDTDARYRLGLAIKAYGAAVRSETLDECIEWLASQSCGRDRGWRSYALGAAADLRIALTEPKV